MRGEPSSGTTSDRTTFLSAKPAVEDVQGPPAERPGVPSQQFDSQFAFGPERHRRSGGPGLGGQLGFAEVEPPREGQEPGGLFGVAE